jgi:hypothetical protein
MSKAVIVTANTISFHAAGKFNQVNISNPQFANIKELVKSGKLEEAAKLIDLKPQVLAAIAGSKAELRGNTVYFNGEAVHSILGHRIVSLAQQGFTIEPMLRFLENLMSNPSKRAVDELYGFLEASKLPITDDGHFLAYKSVRQDFKDHHTGTMDNSPGTVVRMDRNKVDEDKDRTCSYGLHFAAHEYASNFGSSGRMVVLKINPRDVVAIPSDYNKQKGRACEYLVLEEVDRSDTKLVGKAIVGTPAAPKIVQAAPKVVGTPRITTPAAPVSRDVKRVPCDAGIPVKVGDKVRHRKSSPFYGLNTKYNPNNTAVGVVTDIKYLGTDTSRGVHLNIYVKWETGGSNCYNAMDLEFDVLAAPTTPTAPAYTPEADNYQDTKRWVSAKTRGIRKFIGTKEQFPVNRDVAYSLSRVSKDKEYRGDFYFTSYTAQGNLVFVRNDREGKAEKYVTIKNLNDWVIRYNSN